MYYTIKPTLFWAVLTFSTVVATYGPVCNCLHVNSTVPELAGTYMTKLGYEYSWETNDGKNLDLAEDGKWVMNSNVGTLAVYDDGEHTNTPPIGLSKWKITSLELLATRDEWFEIDCDTCEPTESPITSNVPMVSPTASPAELPSEMPTEQPTTSQTATPTYAPTNFPTASPTVTPTVLSTNDPTFRPSPRPSPRPTKSETPSGIGGAADWDYCTPTSKCTEGQGDCDSDIDCASGLTCGEDNCRAFHPTARKGADCCYDKPGIGASDDWDYCTSTHMCSEGQGDCDFDNDCATGLTCGVNNCREFNLNAQERADCCYKQPPTEAPTSDPTFGPSPRPSPSPTESPISSGHGGDADWNYCKLWKKCSEGEGDCDSDFECAPGLTCGDDNCRDFHHTAVEGADCCYKTSGIGASDDWAYCTSINKCKEGQGDCDDDTDCSSGLTCGEDNCREFHINAEEQADCCYKPGIGASNDWTYCSSTNKCDEGQGDCDADSHCAAGLKCGQNNCKEFHPNALGDTDCCFKPANGGKDDRN